jgi:hypothetical protein
MENSKESIRQLAEIRDLMERSSRFISLSGLSGISAGIIALAGSAIAFFSLGFDQRYFTMKPYAEMISGLESGHPWLNITLDALVMLALALSSGIYFTTRRARNKGMKVWDNTARRLVVNLLIPLVAGGILCLLFIYHQLYLLLAPITLLFYGLALINASKYTFHEIRFLGISVIVLGLLASWLPGYGILFWAAGFGLGHIVYGVVMYLRYESKRDEGRGKVTGDA